MRKKQLKQNQKRKGKRNKFNWKKYGRDKAMRQKTNQHNNS